MLSLCDAGHLNDTSRSEPGGVSAGGRLRHSLTRFLLHQRGQGLLKFRESDVFSCERSFVETEKGSIEDCLLGVKSLLDHFPISNGPRNVPFADSIAHASPFQFGPESLWFAWTRWPAGSRENIRTGRSRVTDASVNHLQPKDLYRGFGCLPLCHAVWTAEKFRSPHPKYAQYGRSQARDAGMARYIVDRRRRAVGLADCGDLNDRAHDRLQKSRKICLSGIRATIAGLPAGDRSKTNQVCCPTYQGALTVKMRSLPRASSTHSRRRPR